MNGFREGEFDRGSVSPWARRFCPASSSLSLLDVNPAKLAAQGKRLVLLDVDNTLVAWRSETIPPSTIEWVEAAKRENLELCMLSNTRHPARLERIARKLGIHHIRGRFKPSPAMYRQALARFGVSPEQAVMIGDQIFTDVWGANRAGIEAIWVRPLTSRDFFGTKFSRLGERLVRPALYRGLSGEADAAEALGDGPPLMALLRVPVVRQFVKFAIVGGSSFVIDVGLHFALMFVLRADGKPLGESFGAWLIANFPALFSFAKEPSAAAFPVFKVFTASLGILNSFHWNRRWTFKIRDRHERLSQFQRFVIVSVLGMALNAAIATSLNNVIPGHSKRSWAVATAVATVVVAFWNFTGQKFWAFRRPSPN